MFVGEFVFPNINWFTFSLFLSTAAVYTCYIQYSDLLF